MVVSVLRSSQQCSPVGPTFHWSQQFLGWHEGRLHATFLTWDSGNFSGYYMILQDFGKSTPLMVESILQAQLCFNNAGEFPWLPSSPNDDQDVEHLSSNNSTFKFNQNECLFHLTICTYLTYRLFYLNPVPFQILHPIHTCAANITWQLALFGPILTSLRQYWKAGKWQSWALLQVGASGDNIRHPRDSWSCE